MMICVKHVGWVKKLGGIVFESVRQLVKYGSSLALASKYKEMISWSGISFLSSMWGMTFLEMLFMIALNMSYNQNAARHGSPRQFANLVV